MQGNPRDYFNRFCTAVSGEGRALSRGRDYFTRYVPETNTMAKCCPSGAGASLRMPLRSAIIFTMCGRYRLSRRKQVVEEYFESPSEEEEWSPRYNIAPTQPVATIRQDGARRILSAMRWGLGPSWGYDIGRRNRLINGRSETILEKPAFRDSFLTRRCLIPADGFYEWKKSGKEKQPFHFGMKDNSLFAFAGVWDRWKSASGQLLESCSILTTRCQSVHWKCRTPRLRRNSGDESGQKRKSAQNKTPQTRFESWDVC